MGIERFGVLAAQRDTAPEREIVRERKEGELETDIIVTPLSAVNAMRNAMQWMAATGAVDSEFDTVRGWIQQVESEELPPKEALRKIQALTASRQDYH